LRGRAFDDRDTPASRDVIIVNAAFVKKYLPHQDPIGSHVAQGDSPLEVVGVVGDVQQQQPGWGDYGPLTAVPTAYMPAAQISGGFAQLVHTWFSPSWVVRTHGHQPGLIAGMQRAMAAVDPQLPFAGFRTIDDLRSRALTQQRFQAILLGAMAGLALLLAAIGVYGLISNSVAERRRELGIRLALGATLLQAMRAVTLPGIALAVVGVVLGGVAARSVVQVLQSLVWGVRPTDPPTFAAVALLLLAVAATASLIPALRIARLNPAETLRQE
jgi:hypothetical protein